MICTVPVRKIHFFGKICDFILEKIEKKIEYEKKKTLSETIAPIINHSKTSRVREKNSVRSLFADIYIIVCVFFVHRTITPLVLTILFYIKKWKFKI